MGKKIQKIIPALVMFFAGIVGVGVTYAQSGTVELEGYAWSDGIGWISLNCKTGSPTASDICGISNYKVTVGTGGALSGYGWSDNLGWIKFGGLSGFPSGGTNATYDSVTGKISGFARFCSGLNGSNYFSINNSCSGSARTDGWDGWLSLSGTTPNYGVTVASNGLFSGFAWGDSVVGWVDFSAVKLSTSIVAPSETVFLDVGTVPPGSPVGTPASYVPALLTSVPSPIGQPFTLEIATTQKLYYKWNTSSATSCAFSGASNGPVPAIYLVTGSSGVGLSLPVGQHYLALTCTMTSGATIVRVGTINVLDIGVWLYQNPNITTTSDKAALSYYTVGVTPGSCDAYSLDASNYGLASTWPNNELGPFGTGPGLQSSLPVSVKNLVGTSVPPNTSDWNPAKTLTTISGGQYSGYGIITRESSQARYYVECLNPLNGKVVHASVDVGPLEVIPMTLRALKSGVVVTQVNQGDNVDLEYAPQSMGYTFSSCQGKATDITGGGSTPLSISNWNGPIVPSFTPQSVTVPSYVNGVSTAIASGDVEYEVSCVTPWGALASATTIVRVNATGNLVLSASPSSFLENTSGLKTTLSWSHPNTSLFGLNACLPGDGTPGSTGLKLNGVWKPASNWSGLPKLGSPNDSQPNVEVKSASVGTIAEYSIICKDINGVSHIARANITYIRPPQDPLQQAIIAQCLPDDVNATEFEVSWISTPSSNTGCYQVVSPSNTSIPWTPGPHGDGLPPTPGSPYNPTGLLNQYAVNSGSFTLPYTTIQPQGYTVTMQCYDEDENPIPGTVSTTIYPDCRVETGSSGPRKPRFEEF